MVATNAVWRKEQQASPTAPRGNEHRVRAKGYAELVLVGCCQLHGCLPLCLHVLVVRMCAGSEEERLNEILDHLEGGAETVRAFESARARTRILLIFSRIFSCPPPPWCAVGKRHLERRGRGSEKETVFVLCNLGTSERKAPLAIGGEIPYLFLPPY